MLILPKASRSEIVVLSGTYFTFFALIGLMVPYLSVYLDRLGYDSETIGLISSSVAAMRIIAPSLWSALADKTGQHIFIARLGAFLAFLSLSLLFWVETKMGRLLALSLFNFFWTAILPQLEVISLRKLASVHGLYARVRIAGSIGFMVVATFAGIFIAEHGPNAFVVIGLALSLALLVNLYWVPAPPDCAPNRAEDSGRPRFITLPFIGILGCCFLIQASHGAYYTFFILHMTSLGYSDFAAGSLSAIGVISEIILFWYIGYWFKRYHELRILQLAILLTISRWLLMAEVPHLWPLLVLSLILHAASYGMIHTSVMRWLHSNVAPLHQSKAQALYAGIGFGGGSVLGAAVAGALWQQGQGAEQTYLICAGMAATAWLLYRVSLANGAHRQCMGTES